MIRQTPRRSRLLLACVLAAATAATPSGARADHGDAGERERQELARRYVDAGLAAEAAHDYRAALDLYQRAYEVMPHPLLIYDLAEAHRLAGEDAEAVADYRRYLTADPHGPRAADARDKLETLVRSLPSAADHPAAATTEPSAGHRPAPQVDEKGNWPPARPTEGTRRATTSPLGRRPEEADGANAAPTARASSRRRARWLTDSGIAVGAAGVLGLAAGAYFGRRAALLSDEVALGHDPADIAAGERAERAQIISLTVGGALTAAGSLLIVLGRRATPRMPPLTIAPTAGSPGAALSLTGSW